MDIQIIIANKMHIHFAKNICDLIEESAQLRGTGIARREVTYIEQKILSGNSVIAVKVKSCQR